MINKNLLLMLKYYITQIIILGLLKIKTNALPEEGVKLFHLPRKIKFLCLTAKIDKFINKLLIFIITIFSWCNGWLFCYNSYI